MSGGYVLWEGASQIDGTPIAVLLTLSKGNGKTAMGGLTILPGLPVLAPLVPAMVAKSAGGRLYGPGARGAGSLLLQVARAGLDVGICGDCHHKDER